MPSTGAKKAAERIAELESKVEDMADFVGRLVASVHGDDYNEDSDAPHSLVWQEIVNEPGSPDERVHGWWSYQAPGGVDA